MFLLDTDHVSIIQRQPRSSLVARIKDRGLQYFFVSIVSFHEQARGWNAYQHAVHKSSGSTA